MESLWIVLSVMVVLFVLHVGRSNSKRIDAFEAKLQDLSNNIGQKGYEIKEIKKNFNEVVGKYPEEKRFFNFPMFIHHIHEDVSVPKTPLISRMKALETFLGIEMKEEQTNKIAPHYHPVEKKKVIKKKKA